MEVVLTPIIPGAKKKIWLVDFDDSFTYNISSELYERGVLVDVVHWSQWDQLYEQLKSSHERSALILGPGPGHPCEYPLKGLNQLHGREKLFICGVCLGHQLIWQEMGLALKTCQTPIHGQQVEIEIPEWFSFLPHELHGKKTRVQRYNSLCVLPDFEKMPAHVNVLIQERELLAASFENTLTYQFHPESVGTSFRQSFFTPILNFFV